MKNGSTTFGFLDSTFRDFAATHLDLVKTRSALFTCVDSCTKPGTSASWHALLVARSIKFEVLGDFAWLPASQLQLALNTTDIFPSFTEAYFMATKPNDVAGLKHTFTSDWADFSRNVPKELSHQMSDVGADGYLSDGCGLNFAFSNELAGIVFK